MLRYILIALLTINSLYSQVQFQVPGITVTPSNTIDLPVAILTNGNTVGSLEFALNYDQTIEISSYIREHGVTQFLNVWKRVKDIENDELKFGDEIECGIFAIDHINKSVRLSVRSAEVSSSLIY